MRYSVLRKFLIAAVIFTGLFVVGISSVLGAPARSNNYPGWAPNNVYLVGTYVSFNGLEYRAIQSHTSQVGFEPPNVPALWGAPLATTPTATPGVGDLGYGTVRGVITDASTGLAISGAVAICTHTSYSSPYRCSGTSSTWSNGNYIFENVYFHDTDQITVKVEASGYITQTITRTAFTMAGMTANFALQPGSGNTTLTPTRTPCPPGTGNCGTAIPASATRTPTRTATCGCFTATRTATRTKTPAVSATPTRTATRTATSGSAPAWVPWTAYSIGQLVSYQGVVYKCRQVHTSQPGWEPPNAPALWLVMP